MKNILFLTALITSSSASSLQRRRQGDDLYLYEHIVYGGKVWKYTPSIFCTTLQGDARNQASSAQWKVKNPTNFRVQFFVGDNCSGRMKEWQGTQKLEDQPSNFVMDGINDAVNSFRLVQQDSP
ncbi:hypothetical protein CONCODRAFT_13833 [Conidiobolus coronatus NRRL 28638]|uniref:Uncharacterized protein n=1 Tax=Conidiobolus coronatus (strain ATCC 28846 / CBS 209.66 / NRRL 28638) TaxID=796925 RepID=A0A137NQ14_CONC2|nr:hypothetical protein CONCODRAFT_13833 [Conidiobolus coronatus NRRL 28638]|eukprot:KXN64839.1 hypothetical protein CONCODRAFT_13833 [Conidiobolus coronatus NRRL 28638]